MEGAIRGMPLLSGPTPSHGDQSCCRKCGKEFVPLFVRSRTCNHCGYAYCSSCSDHQALMPRPGSDAGYDPVNVCAFCIDYLTMTASGKAHLRSLSVSKLKAYLSAYGIPTPAGAVEKGDLVEIIMRSRGPNGCLSSDAEGYYRRNSVPDQPVRRGMFSRPAPAPAPNVNGAGGNARQQRTEMPRPSPGRAQPQGRARTPPPPNAPRPQPRAPRPAQPRPSSQPPPSQGPRSTGVPHAAPPRHIPTPPPVPSLSELLDRPTETLASLSVGTLKGILDQNHVNANVHLLVEKEDLVAKVRTLIEQERRDRERVVRIHALEEQEELAREAEMDEVRRLERERHERDAREREAREQGQQDVLARDSLAPSLEETTQDDGIEGEPVQDDGVEGEHVDEGGEGHMVPNEDDNLRPERRPSPAPPSAFAAASESDTPSTSAALHPLPSHSAPPMPAPKPPSAFDSLALLGRCVVCQDEEANIAIVDCGHLALCMPCSELIMKTTRECPLCRTRIVTEHRLLRIYRT